MNAVTLLAAFLAVFFGGATVGAVVERYRWLAWARREHPDEVDTTWL